MLRALLAARHQLADHEGRRDGRDRTERRRTTVVVDGVRDAAMAATIEQPCETRTAITKEEIGQ